MEFLKYIMAILIRFFLRSFEIIPIKRNRILFYPTNGQVYCNLKYIYLKLNKCDKDISVIWVLSDKVNNIKSCKKNSLSFFYYVMTAQVIIFNNGFLSYIRKREQQVYIETWHGGGAYKKIDAVYKNIHNIYKRKRAMYSVNNIDYVVSSSQEFSKVFKADTGISHAKFLPYGMPRNDMFFDTQFCKNINDKIYRYYKIDKKKKIVLYAPTFRNHGFASNLRPDALLEALYKKTGKEYVLMLRCHPHIVNTIFYGSINNDIINVSDYMDMQELLCAADVLITDYSSCMWDFSLMYKPCFIYAVDLNDYKNERGFHTPIVEWPFPIATNNQELEQNIINFNKNEYINKVKVHHDKLGSFEDGHATERICNLIKKFCNK